MRSFILAVDASVPCGRERGGPGSLRAVGRSDLGDPDARADVSKPCSPAQAAQDTLRPSLHPNRMALATVKG